MPVDQPTPGGPAEREVERAGRRYAVIVRTAVLLSVASLTLFTVPLDRSVAVVLALASWSAFYWGRASRVLVLDTAVIAVLCLGARWIDPVVLLHDSTSWVLVAVSITAVCHQWLCEPVPGFVLTVVLIAAYLAGSAIADPGGWTASLPLGLWTLAEAGLSRGLRVLVRKASRAVDRGTAVGERVRREAEIAAARRADEREHLATMHDTAAATLLAIGTGMVTGREPWLADRAARDLDVLAGRAELPEGQVDLAELLDEVARHSPVDAEIRVTEPICLPTRPAVALCRAAGEALENVARHAGVASAVVTLCRTGDSVRLEVTDTGRGFDPAAVPAQRHGLSRSIVDRVARIGGTAVVRSAPGSGTTVELAWHG
ncbi:sensor histidine kinase [Amycolatopsis magusensis]|uniref:Signal transduction histidine kinase n=1 Tax=Amycolatopsis magusensis TaxID=882444 RepID=A0ABS4PJV7_9PSEU|nr:sensor histidine kinase [Amycolatopsis magusensis]MBP2178916.1 signal transduction histidine kinase [Amycolatopsis magusensis]